MQAELPFTSMLAVVGVSLGEPGMPEGAWVSTRPVADFTRPTSIAPFIVHS
ncbi:MAG TPA: hypothetical protein VIC05_10205 [Solirubrobacteraceae bacterium]|jgi:hypothetical protein